MASLDEQDLFAELKQYLQNESHIKPKLIIFDLDFTLWPNFIHGYYKPPFKRIENNILVDSTKKRVKFYSDVEGILKILNEYSLNNDLKLAVASRSAGTKLAKQIFVEMDWSKYFAVMEIHPGNKCRHITKIYTETKQTNYQEILFIDDDVRNIYSTKRLGIVTHLVKAETGLDCEALINALKNFNEIHQAKK